MVGRLVLGPFCPRYIEVAERINILERALVAWYTARQYDKIALAIEFLPHQLIAIDLLP